MAWVVWMVWRSVRVLTVVLVAGVLAVACGDDGGGTAPRASSGGTGGPTGATSGTGETRDAPASSTTGPTAEELCAAAAVVDDPPVVESPAVQEASGVAAGRRSDGMLWVHNDSGSPAEVVAVGDDGADLGTYEIPDAQSADWEDLAVGISPEGGAHLMFIADTGDNARVTQDVDLRDGGPYVIYRVREPAVEDAGGTTAAPVALPFTYDDGVRDAETLLFDPVTGDLLVVSKEWDGTAAGVYPMPSAVGLAEEGPVDPVVLERAADVHGSEGAFITGGDISADGRLVALRTYADVRFWDRDPEHTVAETLASPTACEVEVGEPQGEAVAFTLDGSGFVTLSEGERQPLLWHRR